MERLIGSRQDMANSNSEAVRGSEGTITYTTPFQELSLTESGIQKNGKPFKGIGEGILSRRLPVVIFRDHGKPDTGWRNQESNMGPPESGEIRECSPLRMNYCATVLIGWKMALRKMVSTSTTSNSPLSRVRRKVYSVSECSVNVHSTIFDGELTASDVQVGTSRCYDSLVHIEQPSEQQLRFIKHTNEAPVKLPSWRHGIWGSNATRNYIILGNLRTGFVILSACLWTQGKKVPSRCSLASLEEKSIEVRICRLALYEGPDIEESVWDDQTSAPWLEFIPSRRLVPLVFPNPFSYVSVHCRTGINEGVVLHSETPYFPLMSLPPCEQSAPRGLCALGYRCKNVLIIAFASLCAARESLEPGTWRRRSYERRCSDQRVRRAISIEWTARYIDGTVGMWDWVRRATDIWNDGIVAIDTTSRWFVIVFLRIASQTYLNAERFGLLLRGVRLRVQGQEAKQRYGRYYHARLVPHRSYARKQRFHRKRSVHRTLKRSASARSRSRGEGAIRAKLTHTPSSSSLLCERTAMFPNDVSVEQHRNARVGKTGDPRENSPAMRGIVRHDSLMRKSESDPTQQGIEPEKTSFYQTRRFSGLLEDGKGDVILRAGITHSEIAPWLTGSCVRSQMASDVVHVKPAKVHGTAISFWQLPHPAISHQSCRQLHGLCHDEKTAAAVVERLNLSSTKENQVQSPAGSLLYSRMWESCRTMPLVGGISRGSPVSSGLAFQRCSILTFHPHRLSRPRSKATGGANYFCSLCTTQRLGAVIHAACSTPIHNDTIALLNLRLPVADCHCDKIPGTADLEFQFPISAENRSSRARQSDGGMALLNYDFKDLITNLITPDKCYLIMATFSDKHKPRMPGKWRHFQATARPPFDNQSTSGNLLDSRQPKSIRNLPQHAAANQKQRPLTEPSRVQSRRPHRNRNDISRFENRGPGTTALIVSACRPNICWAHVNTCHENAAETWIPSSHDVAAAGSAVPNKEEWAPFNPLIFFLFDAGRHLQFRSVQETEHDHKLGNSLVCPLVPRDPVIKQRRGTFRHRWGKMQPDAKSIKSWYDKFKNTGSVADLPRTGRPSTSAERMEAVRQSFVGSPKKLVRRASRELQMPKSTLHGYLTQTFIVSCIQSTNDATKPPDEVSECTRGSPKVNVWCLLRHYKIIGPFFSSEGTITSAVSLDMLQLFAVSQLLEHHPDVISQQNGSPPHWSLEYLRPVAPIVYISMPKISVTTHAVFVLTGLSKATLLLAPTTAITSQLISHAEEEQRRQLWGAGTICYELKMNGRHDANGWIEHCNGDQHTAILHRMGDHVLTNHGNDNWSHRPFSASPASMSSSLHMRWLQGDYQSRGYQLPQPVEYQFEFPAKGKMSTATCSILIRGMITSMTAYTVYNMASVVKMSVQASYVNMTSATFIFAIRPGPDKITESCNVIRHERHGSKGRDGWMPTLDRTSKVKIPLPPPLNPHPAILSGDRGVDGCRFREVSVVCLMFVSVL
ncbi:hypothetical protein PR048_030437 [Dryococelus australis]|uniref:Uncharacterized protein n=1 Tax=Dryococelus australis TaxID=614101 RepID=A0ABQ9G902_9NEOP|nr:hypothetical protein PR048_030437 [Dryococelus australis]